MFCLSHIRTFALLTGTLLAAVVYAADAPPQPFSDDFAKREYSPKWVPQNPDFVKVDTFEGQGLLKIGATGEGERPRLYTMDAPGRWTDFVLDVEARAPKGGWVGVRFHNGWDLFFDEEKNRVLIRKEYQVQQMTDIPTSAEQFKHLRLIVAGDRIIVEVNDKRVFALQEKAVPPSPVGLLVHAADAEYGKFRITSELGIDTAVKIRATDPDGALVYEPGKPINLHLATTNASTKSFPGKLEARLIPAGEWAESKASKQVIGLTGNDLLRVQSTKTGVQLSIAADDPFAITRLGYQMILQLQKWDTLYTRAKIKHSAAGGAGFVFGASPAGRFELAFDNQGRLGLRHISADWKKIDPLGTSTTTYPATAAQTVEVTAANAKIVVKVDGAEALNVPTTDDLAGAAGLLFMRGGGTFDDWVIAASQDREADGWRPKLMEPPAPTATLLTPVTLKPGTTETKVDLKPVPEGYYMLQLGMAATAVKTTYPLCVWKIDPAWANQSADRFPLVVYSKYAWDDADSDEIAANTYLHAMCHTVRSHGLNGILHEFKNPQQFTILAKYGLEPVLRSHMTDFFNQPGVRTIFVGDEPSIDHAEQYKADYEQIKAKLPKAVLLTCMVGEHMGSGKPQDPLLPWGVLQAQDRLFRHYPMRGAEWDILNPKPGMATFLDAFRRANEIATPWQFVLQTYGSEATVMRPNPYWRDPTPAEVLAMAHVALAHGAKGLYLYTLQAEVDWQALVWPRSLAPCDDKLTAIDELTQFIGATQKVLLAAKQSAVGISSSSPQVLAKAMEADGGQYVYAVNMNGHDAQDSKVTIDGPFASATDVASGQPAKVKAADGKSELEVSLKPGRGVLIRVESGK